MGGGGPAVRPDTGPPQGQAGPGLSPARGHVCWVGRKAQVGPTQTNAEKMCLFTGYFHVTKPPT